VRRSGDLFLHLTFRKEVEEKEPEGVLGIDVNEKSIDLAIVKPDKVRFIKIDVSEAKYVKDRYSKKWRCIQGKTSGKKKAELLEKYSGREERRLKDVLHKASEIIAQIIDEERVRPVMERLTKIGERIRYGRKMNRRLHNILFMEVQSYITYKSKERGYDPEIVSAKKIQEMPDMWRVEQTEWASL